jgi:hypothetical protein
MIHGSLTRRQVQHDSDLLESIEQGRKERDKPDPRPCLTRKMTPEERRRYGMPEEVEE